MAKRMQVRAIDGVLLAFAPMAAGLTAFSIAARAHVVDTLLAGAVCGNPGQGAEWVFFGHCAPCWEAGAAAFAFTLAAGLVLRSLLTRTPVPAAA